VARFFFMEMYSAASSHQAKISPSVYSKQQSFEYT